MLHVTYNRMQHILAFDLKKQGYKRTYPQNKNRVSTDLENELMVTKVKGKGRDILGDWD